MVSKDKAIQAEEARRQEVYAKMSPKVQQAAKLIDGYLDKANKGTLLIYYDIGKTIDDVNNEDGEEAVKQIEDFLGQKSKTTLYYLREVSRTFTRDEVSEMATQKMAGGARITISHLGALTQISRADKRKKLLNRVFAETLSVNQLTAEIRALSADDKGEPRSGGRKPSRPSSVNSGVSQIRSKALELHNRISVWRDHVLAPLEQLEPDKITPKLVEDLKAADKQIDTLRTELEQFDLDLNNRLADVEKIIAELEDSTAQVPDADNEDDFDGVGGEEQNESDDT